ncbi:MAG: hypothetical protein Q7S74_00245 [Nanoarchaeota archaeon]|nr:hypothetical protein [Nanoarchaeota archaeon]
MQNQTTEKGQVSFYESPVYQIVKQIKEEGYLPASINGAKLDESDSPSHSGVGILKSRPPIKQGLLGFLGIETRQRALHLGTIWLENDRLGAKSDSNWKLEAYGRESFSELKEFMGDMSSKYNVKIDSILSRETPHLEAYASDDY